MAGTLRPEERAAAEAEFALLRQRFEKAHGRKWQAELARHLETSQQVVNKFAKDRQFGIDTARKLAEARHLDLGGLVLLHRLGQLDDRYANRARMLTRPIADIFPRPVLRDLLKQANKGDQGDDVDLPEGEWLREAGLALAAHFAELEPVVTDPHAGKQHTGRAIKRSRPRLPT